MKSTNRSQEMKPNLKGETLGRQLYRLEKELKPRLQLNDNNPQRKVVSLSRNYLLGLKLSLVLLLVFSGVFLIGNLVSSFEWFSFKEGFTGAAVGSEENIEANLDAQDLTIQSIIQCGNVSHSITLAQNITYNGSDQGGTVSCINITASNVVLDCNGYWLIGPNNGSSSTNAAIHSVSTNNVTVKNCNFRGFNPRTINLESETNWTITGNNFTQSWINVSTTTNEYIFAIGTGTVNISHNRFENYYADTGSNKGPTPFAIGNNHHYSYIGYNFIKNITSVNNQNCFGISSGASANVTVTNNQFHDYSCPAAAVTTAFLTQGAGTNFTHNLVNNSVYGVLFISSQCYAFNNTFYNLSLAGIAFSSATTNVLVNSTYVNITTCESIGTSTSVNISGSTYTNCTTDISVTSSTDINFQSGMMIDDIYIDSNSNVTFTNLSLGNGSSYATYLSLTVSLNATNTTADLKYGTSWLSINATGSPGLNRTANITFLGVNYDNNLMYKVLKDGVNCSECRNIGSGPIIFQVNHFSNYTAFGCGTINSNITLLGNITVPGTCFTINASNIVIDGDGYTITGNSVGYGINISNFNYITVKDFAEIIGFTEGVYTLNTSNTTIANNTIIINGLGGGLYGVSLRNGSNNNVSNNYVNTTATVGIFEYYSSANLVYANDINTSTNNGIGVMINGSNHSRYYSNEIFTWDSGSPAVVVYVGSNNINISFNTIKTSGSEGIIIDSSNHSIITSNILTKAATGNTVGVEVNAGYNSTISSNTISTSNGNAHGVYLLGKSGSNAIFANSIFINAAVDNTYGIAIVLAGSSNTVISNNITTYANAAAIILSSSGNNHIISGNNITGNGTNAYGILFTSNNRTTFSTNKIVTNGSGASGVGLSDSSFNDVYSNVIYANRNGARGFLLTDGSDSNNISINNITIFGNAEGLEISSSNYNNITSNNITVYQNMGVNISTSNFTLVLDNRINSYAPAHQAIGIDGYNNTVYNNIVNASYIGILFEAYYSNVSNNNITTFGTNGSGLVPGGESNVVINNIITTNGSGAHGIWSLSGDGSTISENLITTTNTSAYGIYLNGSTNNTFSNNKIVCNNSVEIYVDATATNNTFINNLLMGNENFSSLSSLSVSIDVNLTPEANPSGKINLSDYLTIANITPGGYLEFNLSYNASDVAYVTESTVRVYRHDATRIAWEVLASSTVDTVNNYVASGNVTSFSLFAPFGNVPTTPTTTTSVISGESDSGAAPLSAQTAGEQAEGKEAAAAVISEEAPTEEDASGTEIAEKGIKEAIVPEEESLGAKLLAVYNVVKSSIINNSLIWLVAVIVLVIGGSLIVGFKAGTVQRIGYDISKLWKQLLIIFIGLIVVAGLFLLFYYFGNQLTSFLKTVVKTVIETILSYGRWLVPILILFVSIIFLIYLGVTFGFKSGRKINTH